jgi:hypothetical protein
LESASFEESTSSSRPRMEIWVCASTICVMYCWMTILENCWRRLNMPDCTKPETCDTTRKPAPSISRSIGTNIIARNSITYFHSCADVNCLVTLSPGFSSSALK